MVSIISIVKKSKPQKLSLKMDSGLKSIKSNHKQKLDFKFANVLTDLVEPINAVYRTGFV